MDKYVISNLVMENAFTDKLFGKAKKEADVYSERTVANIKICRLRIKDEDARREYNCKIGEHVTIFTPVLWSLENSELDNISSYVGEEINHLLTKLTDNSQLCKSSVIVAGLGNMHITPDSLGPLTIKKVCVTRHMELMNRSLFESSKLCSVCTINCGVMGETGLRSLEVIKGIVNEIRADAVIAVDALAARECDRLGAVVQISDSGIAPGAGIGNRQYPVNRETLGIPVISIGVPTVVSAASIVEETVKKCGASFLISDYEEIINERKNFFVSPKECDIIVDKSSFLISQAINKALGVI